MGEMSNAFRVAIKVEMISGIFETKEVGSAFGVDGAREFVNEAESGKVFSVEASSNDVIVVKKVIWEMGAEGIPESIF